MEAYELDVNHRRKKCIAFILALIFYVLMLIPLLFDILHYQDPINDIKNLPIKRQPQLVPKRHVPIKFQPTKPLHTQTSLTQQSPSPQPSTAKPTQTQNAPVTVPLQTTEEPPQKTGQSPPIAPSASTEQDNSQQQPPVKPKDSPIKAKKTEAVTAPKKVESTQVPALQTIKPQLIDDEPEESYEGSYSRRSSRHKWYREPSDAYTSLSPDSNKKQKPSRQVFDVAQGFYTHMTHEQEQRNATALNYGGAVDGFEARLFNQKFIVELCQESYMNPLRLFEQLLEPHCIQLEVTCSKARKVVNFRFIQPSPHAQINHYLQQLLNTMITPILPSEIKGDIVTFPIYIIVEQQYKHNLIWFVPTRNI